MGTGVVARARGLTGCDKDDDDLEGPTRVISRRRRTSFKSVGIVPDYRIKQTPQSCPKGGSTKMIEPTQLLKSIDAKSVWVTWIQIRVIQNSTTRTPGFRKSCGVEL
jgi:hypothetical protein